VSHLKIRLFGKLSLLYNDHELECLQSAKAKELFCYLLLHRDHPHSREVLASLLWGDYTTAQSKKCFRQTLWQLQQVFHNLHTQNQIHLIEADGEYLRLNPNAEISLDVGMFEKAFAPVRCLKGEQLENKQAQLLRDAVSLYCGDLLEGWFQDWCIFHRERLQSMHLAMLDKLMSYCEFHRQYEDGLSFGERLLRQDNARERTYFSMMRLHYLAGDRGGALRKFHRCETALEKELGVKPARRTVELYDQIRSDQFSAPALARAEREQSSPAKIRTGTFVPRLRRLRWLLSSLHRRLERDIHEVDRALATHASRPSSEKHFTH
jgi:DNA-binding SARP family transcriptional activator